MAAIASAIEPEGRNQARHAHRVETAVSHAQYYSTPSTRRTRFSSVVGVTHG